LKKWHDKLQEKPFTSRVKLTHFFNSSKNVFGEDTPFHARSKSEATKLNLAEHERAWRPSMPPRSGAFCTLAKFPEFKPDPPKEVTRKRPVEGEEPRPSFKLTYRKKTAPCSSIATNTRNVKT